MADKALSAQPAVKLELRLSRSWPLGPLSGRAGGGGGLEHSKEMVLECLTLTPSRRPGGVGVGVASCWQSWKMNPRGLKWDLKPAVTDFYKYKLCQAF